MLGGDYVLDNYDVEIPEEPYPPIFMSGRARASAYALALALRSKAEGGGILLPQSDRPVTTCLSSPERVLPRAVTPMMREAGASVIQEWHGVVDSEFLAEQVYTAMDTLRLADSRT